MIIDYKGETYEFPDHTLTHLDYRSLNRDIQSELPATILNDLLNSLDCTKEFSCGRPMMTEYPMYARHINAFLYVVSSIKEDSEDEAVNINIKQNKEDWISKLIARHKENLLFEKNNPYISPTPKKKQKSHGKIIKYKTKDLITGEDAYLLEDTKTKKHVIRKNPNALDEIRKAKSEIPLNMMTFNFNKK